MATRSFYEDLILDTPEAIANMEKVFEKYEKEGGLRVSGEVEICKDFAFLDKVMKRVKE